MGIFPVLLTRPRLERRLQVFVGGGGAHCPLLGGSAACCSNYLFSGYLHTDSKPTVETLGPTVKSEETTTPYPMDEDATECGENCSFEDGKDWSEHHISSWVAWVRTRQELRIPWLEVPMNLQKDSGRYQYSEA